MIHLTFPKPPSVNALYRSTARSGFVSVYISPKGRSWMQGALWALKSQVTRQGGIRKLQLPITHEIDNLEITFFFKGRWDYDNGLKATNDLLTKGGVISDDSIITKALIRKVKVARKEDERVEITL